MQFNPPSSLPPVDDLSAQHSAQVSDHLRQKIAAAGGELSFAEFMHELLYAPGLGYYSAGSRKFGGAGDFTTAPEVSGVFGRIVARQCSEILAMIEGGEVLEFGAGSGRLAVDMLRTFDVSASLPARYNILEVSADLENRQRELLQAELPHLVDRVHWLTEIPVSFDGVMVANEVLDALPVERFVRRTSGIFQCCVAVDAGRFVCTERPAAGALESAVLAIEAALGDSFADGYTSEVSLSASTWISELAMSLTQGAIFLFDYGVSQAEYYAADRANGWLRCHFRHRAHNDPLILAGIQDVTAWVDFSSVAESAVACGLEILGYQAQAQFLMAGGLDIEMQGFAALSAREQLELSGQIKTLTLPAEMGETFKAMGLARGDIEVPSAFRSSDRTKSL